MRFWSMKNNAFNNKGPQCWADKIFWCIVFSGMECQLRFCFVDSKNASAYTQVKLFTFQARRQSWFLDLCIFCFICYLKFFCKVKRNDFYIIFMRLIIVVRWVDKYEDLISRCQLEGWRFSPERHLLDWMLKCTTTRVTNKFSLQLFGSDVLISRAPRKKNHILPGDSKSWLCFTARCLSC